ncbi:MAG: phage tail sheath subtilisin-like domain-containing protein [Xanthomonadaceae bacterium]|nr:phage tail sheath subtilisin-like domain-containing protein [Xanthomonadaceae bacterium]
MQNFLHGVETVEIERGAKPVRVIKTGVIAIVGTAPIGPNTFTLSLNETDAAAFGPPLPGFTLPESLRSIYRYGVGTVIVVNVLDRAVHKTAVAAEAATLVADRLTTAHPALLNLTVQSADLATTYVADTDYAVDLVTGVVTRKAGGAIAAGATLSLGYEYADPTKVTTADVIGATAVDGSRSGLQALLDVYSAFGFDPKILIAPGFGTLSSVAAELEALADRFEAVAYADAPIGTTVTQAITGRGPLGTINFNSSSERVRLCYPHVQVFDTATNAPRLEPLSVHAAALRAKVDQDDGYWVSSSNHELVGVIGLERPLTARDSDPASEVNLLNEVGITTVFNSFGTGFRLWGNRTAAWPSNTGIRTFESSRRTADVINESLRVSSLQFVDRPLDQALIDSLVATGDAFMRKQQGDGATIGYAVWYDPARNPEQNLALGNLRISYRFTPALPMERLTYESEITSEFLVTFQGS